MAATLQNGVNSEILEVKILLKDEETQVHINAGPTVYLLQRNVDEEE